MNQVNRNEEVNRRGSMTIERQTTTPTRRRFLASGLAVGMSLALAACASGKFGSSAAPSPAVTIDSSTNPPTSAAATPSPQVAADAMTPVSATASTPTLGSVDSREVTSALTEGPYFKANSPERTSLVDAAVAGTKLALSGQVFSAKGQPIARALLDFWQANDGGAYDNAGYTLRGHQFTDTSGHYQLETVIPGLYPGRTRHIHVKVQAPNQAILTTQLFFSGEPQNATDGIFSPKLVLPIQDAPTGGKTAIFNFVLPVG